MAPPDDPRGEASYERADRNLAAVAALGSMALSMCSAILLISDVVFDAPIPVLTTCGAASVFAWLWFVRPVRRRNRLE